jgi:hypothetical protein
MIEFEGVVAPEAMNDEVVGIKLCDGIQQCIGDASN